MHFSKKRIPRWVPVVTVGLALTLIPALALAQHGRHESKRGRHLGPGPQIHRLLGTLELTDSQQEQIHEVLSQRREQMGSEDAAMKQARTALQEAIHAVEMDEATIRDAAAALALFEADRAVEMATTFQSVQQILTAEQREDFQSRLSRLLEEDHGVRGFARRAPRRGAGLHGGF